MAKKEVKKGSSPAPAVTATPTAVKSVTAANTPLTDANSMEKIRDILFGNQLKEFEKRFTRLEERVGRETEEIRGDLKKRFDTLEAYIRSEIESFADRLKKEQESRGTANEALQEEIKTKITAADSRIEALDTQLGNTIRDLRQQLLDQSKALSEEIQGKAEQAALNLDQAMGTLQGEKVDRATLSSFLVELAVRLSDEPTLTSLVAEPE
jgi:exonuclease VII large subunit